MNLFFFVLNFFLLLVNVVLHIFPDLFLLCLVFAHVVLQVVLQLLDFLYLTFLVFEHLSSLLQLVVLIPQTVDLGLELVRLLLFNHLHIPQRDLLNLREAAVRNPISLQPDVDQSGVLVELLKHEGFNRFTEKVI